MGLLVLSVFQSAKNRDQVDTAFSQVPMESPLVFPTCLLQVAKLALAAQPDSEIGFMPPKEIDLNKTSEAPAQGGGCKC